MTEEYKKLIEELEGYKHIESSTSAYSDGWNEAIEQAIEIIKSKNIKVEKVDTYKCQSVVEGGEVKNCTCGKCF